MNIKQLLKEQKEKFENMFVKTLKWEHGSLQAIVFESEKDSAIFDWHTASIMTIIRSEIERKKLMLKDDEINPDTKLPYYSDYWKGNKDGYNTAITEDIAYLENVLMELENNYE